MGKPLFEVIAHVCQSRHSVQQLIAILIVSQLQGMYT
jgi:hypothetical protein